jgi:UDP:flavonoid glycosyltransferase YjiC (YdhE family)
LKIAIIAPGSRGDVQPYVALGKGFLKAGHTVRIVTHEDFRDLTEAHGVPFWPISGEIQAIAQSPDMRARLEGGNFLSILRLMSIEAERAAVTLAEGGLAACDDVELIIGGIGGVFTGIALAEKLDLPFIQAYVVPFTPTSAFPSALLPVHLPDWLPALNRVSHQLLRQVMWRSFRRADRIARRDILGIPQSPNLGPYHSPTTLGMPILYGLSPSVIPKPRDWEAKIHMTGFWFLDSEAAWSPPADLLEFLDDGVRPVYIGFGSMSQKDPQATLQLILEALKTSRQRAIITAGWGGLGAKDLPETVYMLPSAPHSWLFQQVAAVIHHGGAGTTAAGLRAGVPSLVIPFFGDQPFWGKRIAMLGVGPKPIPRKRLASKELANALLHLVNDQAMSENAQALGRRIQAEKGVDRAVEIVESISQFQ